MKRQAVSPTTSNASKKLKSLEDLDRIVPDLSAEEVPRHVLDLGSGKVPSYGDPVDRCALKKAGKN